MKKILSITLVLIIAISLTACGGGSTENGNPAKKLSGSISSSKKMEHSEGIKKLMELSEKLMNGEITSEESKKMQKDIKNNMESQEEFIKRTTDNISDFNDMPIWAKSVNMLEPKGLILVESESSIIKAKGTYSDGFMAVYKGDIKKLISETKRIAKELELATDFEDANTGTIMISGEVDKYTVGITVADNGDGAKMYYTASDLTAQKELMEKHKQNK